MKDCGKIRTRRQIAPILGDVKCVVKRAAAPWLWRDQGKLVRGPVVIGIAGGSLYGGRLLAGGRWTWEANLGLRREERRVDGR